MAVKWEYELGPLTLNFRVLLEPKGFLRILMVIISILAFSLTVDFSRRQNSNSLTCLSASNFTSTNISRTVELEFSYPFLKENFVAKYEPFDEFVENMTEMVSSCGRNDGFDTRSFAGFAQFFVAMGVLTFLYCIGIVIVYVLFINPKLPFAKWLLVFDFIASFLFAFLYLLADILWSAGIPGLRTYVDTELKRRGEDCLICISTRDVDPGSYAMPAISVVFGWLLFLVWCFSLWYTYKDTYWHKDKTGPLAEKYSPRAPEQSGDGAEPSPGPPSASPPETVTGTY